jgi:hypothetical protein
MNAVRPQEFWKEHIDGFRQSGMSLRKYCRTNDLKISSLQYHLKKSQVCATNMPGHIENECGTWLPLTIVDEPIVDSQAQNMVRLQFSRITIEAGQECDPIYLANVLREVSSLC